MKNASFIVAEAKIVGKDQALELAIPFEEGDAMKEQMLFMFEELKMEEITFRYTDADITDLP